jgi:hypothetical protein
MYVERAFAFTPAAIISDANVWRASWSVIGSSGSSPRTLSSAQATLAAMDDEPIQFEVNIDEAVPRVREATDEALRTLVADMDLLFGELGSVATGLFDDLAMEALPADDLKELVHRIAYMLFAWWFIGKTGARLAAEVGIDDLEFSQLVDETIEHWAEEVGYDSDA